MVHLPNLEKSVEANVLWPPIADAVGTFIRRRASGADGYELTWRLIHVWEAASSVLSGAVTSRLREIEPSGAPFLRCREHLHGRTWSPLSKTFNRSQGALDGSATRRIDLLWDLENFEVDQSRFLQSAKKFLKSDGLRLRGLVDSWKQICDVPDEIARGDEFSVRDSLRHVNTFRNRFAHVPFPFDEMASVSEKFADVTEQLFSIEPRPWQSFPDDRIPNPLSGGIDVRGRRLRGSQPPQLTTSTADGVQFVFPAISPKTGSVESWEAAPFVHVDSMFRPSILTRLISEANGVWEYTRFLAERNSVIRHEAPSYLAQLPIPTTAEYASPVEEEEKPQERDAAASPSGSSSAAASETDFDKALRHIANSDYEPAIAFFQQLVQERPEYHIGWLRLGYALRELAMRKRLLDPTEAAALFNRSIDALGRAAEHTHLPRKAQALYELSKALFHRSRLASTDNGQADLDAALRKAVQAHEISPDTRYETWISYINQHSSPAASTAPTTGAES